jgi:hypothetical protein
MQVLKKHILVAIFIFSIIIIFLGLSITSRDSLKSLKNDLRSAWFIPKSKESEQAHAADKMLKRLFSTDFSRNRHNILDLAKRANYFVFNYCDNNQPFTSNPLDLFEECHTACGGFVYVFQAIMEVFGISTRNFSLYNIPNQGNHALVEVEYEPGKWALFDPTFGSYFTEDGSIEGTPLSMDEIQYKLMGKNLLHYVVSAKVADSSSAVKNLSNIYIAGSFERNHMKIGNYHLAEVWSENNKEKPIYLTLPLDLAEGYIFFGSSNYREFSKADQEFLEATNKTLNDDVLENDTSYLFSYLGEKTFNRKQRNIIKIKNLSPGATYELIIMGFNLSNEVIKFLASIIDMNSAIINSTEPRNIPGNEAFDITFRFRAKSNETSILIETLKEKGSLRIFGVDAKKLFD